MAKYRAYALLLMQLAIAFMSANCKYACFGIKGGYLSIFGNISLYVLYTAVIHVSKCITIVFLLKYGWNHSFCLPLAWLTVGSQLR